MAVGAVAPSVGRRQRAAREPSSRSIESLSVPGGPVAGVLDEKLARASGPVDVWVTLADAPVAAAASTLVASRMATGGREQTQGLRSLREAPQAMREALRAHRVSVVSRQNTAAGRLHSLGGVGLGRVNVAHNAIAVRIAASR